MKTHAKKRTNKFMYAYINAGQITLPGSKLGEIKRESQKFSPGKSDCHDLRQTESVCQGRL